jgi:hypothetical protein
LSAFDPIYDKIQHLIHSQPGQRCGRINLHSFLQSQEMSVISPARVQLLILVLVSAFSHLGIGFDEFAKNYVNF